MNLTKEAKDRLYSQLVKLGDMIGDGDQEPWVNKEYARVLNALGIGPKRKNRSVQINKFMKKRVIDAKCLKCSGILKQTKSGSMRGICVDCGSKYWLMKIGKNK